jgi:chromosome segregation ATPase
MTKKQLQSQINDLKKAISSLQGRSNIYQSRLDKMDNILSKPSELDVRHKEYLDKINSTAKERWQMLKDYLKVEEEEYATLTTPFKTILGDFPSEAVKQTRLVPIKKGKK